MSSALHDVSAARFSSGGKKVEYYRNHPLSGSECSDCDRALVVIHGFGRNADDYYNSVREAQDTFPGVGDNTLVIAPRFQSEEDNPAADELYWNKTTWSMGEDSLDGQEFSSFAVLDDLLESISSNFQNVKDVVLAGHGAGAQFVQRYAGIAGVPDIRCDIKIRYVVANPGSYMFPTAERPRTTVGCNNNNAIIGNEEYTMGGIGVDACPSGTSIIRDQEKCSHAAAFVNFQYNSYAKDLEVGETGLCVAKNLDKPNVRVTMTNAHGSSAAWLCEVSSPTPTAEYDRYKYGISNLPNALNYASLSTAQIQRNLVEREVFLLLGTADIRTARPPPDMSCEADAQGLHRYERGMNYRDSVKALDCGARTTIAKVLGVGHDHHDMFTAPQGIMALFIG